MFSDRQNDKRQSRKRPLSGCKSGKRPFFIHMGDIRSGSMRLNREIRRRTRVVGTFPDGSSALMPICARLRYMAGTRWSSKKYMNMKHLETALDDVSIAG